MKVEKQILSGEGGRPVAGFRHLFDWNAKSRKKLLAKNLSEQLKQKTSSNTNMPITRHQPVIENYTAGSLILKSCASSLIDEDDYSKAPGVVARLMGLDSFPISNLSDTKSKSTRFIDTRSMHNSSPPCVKKSPELEHKDHHQIDQKHKVIEKFQMESLPPKSARSVPITHQKLLSPMKRSRLVPLNDPTCIMEAASTIPLARSSSVHVPVSARKPYSRRPVESKVSSRRVVESNAARSLKGQSMNKSWDGCLERKPFLEEGKRSVSLAIQAKVNVKKRDSLSGESTSGQQNRQKDTLKKPSTKNVLKQNNQKQNYITDRGTSAAKSSMPVINRQCKKPVSETSKIPVNKAINRQKRSPEDMKNKVHDKSNISGNAVKSNGSDVISFTFTSPISRSTEKKNLFLAENHGKHALINFIGNRNSLSLAPKGDSSSTLMNKKLNKNVSYVMGGDPLSTLLDKKLKNNVSLAPGGEFLGTLLEQNLRELAAMSSTSVSMFQDTRNVDRIRPIFLAENCVPGTKGCLRKSTMMEVESESESSYVKDLLFNIESMFEDFTLNRTSKIVNPRLFDKLEAQKPVLENNRKPKLRRKLVFDCVSECVDSRCRVWLRGVAVVTRKERLVEDVCNQILKWQQMKDCMVEELVYKDMSDDPHKTWLDYDVEAFELGVEIEKRLLSDLIGEALVDMMVL
ncbi:DUF3741-associated sequence motif protein [Artemisia annua]|uniref:DUF3741-associated sequence motif protein n=1 Tax=Artemisia annua TaxID=35608 RepID=A0A2U1LMA7_ARTAN|nr:DUF3741-associated sequence motif protein [Artemisia annua]